MNVCPDCGLVVGDPVVHARFHSILGGHAWALAVLKTAHLAAHVHDKYEAVERIDSRKFDSWTNDAFEEVTGEAALCEICGRTSFAPDHGLMADHSFTTERRPR